MKRNVAQFFLMLVTVSVLAVACSSKTVAVAPKKVPPGQEKKMTGSQSAKPYAPGQQKKKH